MRGPVIESTGWAGHPPVVGFPVSHAGRHTFASRLAMSGAMEGTIAELLRHSGTALVRRYAHLSDTHLRSEVEKVASFGKAQHGAVADKGGLVEEKRIGDPEVEPAVVPVASEELAGTVTGTVTGS
jgi:hypothetical protein